MNAEDVFVLSANPHFILIAKRMTDTGSLKAISAVQSRLAKSALRKRSLITIPCQRNLLLVGLFQKMLYRKVGGLPVYEIHLLFSFLIFKTDEQYEPLSS
jgi:hypothetical protein